MQPPPPNSSNPFSDAANPYAAPTYAASLNAAPMVPFSRDEARLRLLGPAIGLGIFSILWMMYMGFVVVMILVDPPAGMPQDENAAASVARWVGMALGLGLFIIPSLITLIGAVQMLRVKTYYWCWAAAILGAVPCTMCFPLTMAFGIWGMVALYDVRMKLAFYGGPSPFVTT